MSCIYHPVYTLHLPPLTAWCDPYAASPAHRVPQVNEEMPGRPVSLILLVSAAPPRPEVLAQIVLPADPPQADVDLAIDGKTALAFPNDSFLGAGAFGQVRRAAHGVKTVEDQDLRR